MKKFGTAVILSGGLSRRMGYDKKQLRIGGENIIKRIVKQLSIDFDDIIIAGSKPDELPGVSGVRGVYPDAVEQSASLVGIYTGLVHAQSQYLYVTACDMPVYNHDYVAYMKRCIEDNPGVGGCVTRFEEWIEPFNSFYHVELAPKVETFLSTGQKSIYKCFEDEHLYYIDERIGREFSPDWDMFCNLNTPSELKNHLKKRRDLI